MAAPTEESELAAALALSLQQSTAARPATAEEEDRALADAIAASLAPAAPGVAAGGDAAARASGPQPMEVDAGVGGAPAADEDEELRRALAFSLLPGGSGGGGGGGGVGMSGLGGDGVGVGVGYGYEPATAEARASALLSLIFGDASSTVCRQWLQQGIAFAPPSATNGAPPGIVPRPDGAHPGMAQPPDGAPPGTVPGAPPGTVPFTAGLAQSQGGPCAILAAAQAFTLRRLLFDPRCEQQGPGGNSCEQQGHDGNIAGGVDANSMGGISGGGESSGGGGGGGMGVSEGMGGDELFRGELMGREEVYRGKPRREVAAGGWAAAAGEGTLCPSPAEAREALVAGLTDMLWQAATALPAGADTAGGGTDTGGGVADTGGGGRNTGGGGAHTGGGDAATGGEAPPSPSRVAVVALPLPALDTAGGLAAGPDADVFFSAGGPDVLFSGDVLFSLGRLCAGAVEARSWEETHAAVSARVARLKSGDAALGAHPYSRGGEGGG
jgi:hypothetical protein